MIFIDLEQQLLLHPPLHHMKAVRVVGYPVKRACTNCSKWHAVCYARRITAIPLSLSFRIFNILIASITSDHASFGWASS